MPLAGFEPAIPLTMRPQTYALDAWPPGSISHITLLNYLFAKLEHNFVCIIISVMPAVSLNGSHVGSSLFHFPCGLVPLGK
jgi:hypothetical protein